ncbi:MAG: family 43 glycosylhydrolase [Verrucomicrobiota bacterium]
MRRTLSTLFMLAICIPQIAHAGNPLIPHVYAADPSAHVWPGDDRLWLYTSDDRPGTDTHDTMTSYHVFSTTNLVDWTDYGMVLHLKDVKWAASHMWAIDAVLWKGTYYLVYCAQELNTGVYRTGLATSSQPQGPFTDIGFIQGVDWGQDPALFVDEDGKPYLTWGCGGGCYAAQLSDDLRSAIPGTTVNLKKQLTWVFEGPWIHKYKGQYYLSYPGLPDGQWPEHMYYATADKPLGPYTFRGKFMGSGKKMAGTNHGSIIKYKGHWYFFYHSAWVSNGNGTCRNLMCDELYYNPEGTIQKMEPTTEGVAVEGTEPAPSRVTMLLETENGAPSGGRLFGTHVATNLAGFSGTGYVTGFNHANDSVTVLAQVAKPGKWHLKIRYAAQNDEVARLIVNVTRGKEQRTFPKTDGFAELDLGIIELQAGDNLISLIEPRRQKPTGSIAVDYFKLEPAAQIMKLMQSDDFF